MTISMTSERHEPEQVIISRQDGLRAGADGAFEHGGCRREPFAHSRSITRTLRPFKRRLGPVDGREDLLPPAPTPGPRWPDFLVGDTVLQNDSPSLQP